MNAHAKHQQFARIKANRGSVVLVVAEFAEYSLNIVPPIWIDDRGLSAYAMGEIDDHDKDGKPIYYWFLHQCGQDYGSYGTQEEAFQAFASIPPIVINEPLFADRVETDSVLLYEVRDIIELWENADVEAYKALTGIAERVKKMTPDYKGKGR